jgi:hypothetical protein
VIADPGSWVEKERREYRVARQAKGRAAQICVRHGMGSRCHRALVRDVGNGGLRRRVLKIGTDPKQLAKRTQLMHCGNPFSTVP